MNPIVEGETGAISLPAGVGEEEKSLDKEVVGQRKRGAEGMEPNSPSTETSKRARDDAKDLEEDLTVASSSLGTHENVPSPEPTSNPSPAPAPAPAATTTTTTTAATATDSVSDSSFAMTSAVGATELSTAASSIKDHFGVAAAEGEPIDIAKKITTLAGGINVISTLSASGDHEVIEITPDKVGQIIGSKGAIIQDMQLRSGARIYVNQDFPPGVNRQVTISGTPQQVKVAGDLVRLIIAQGPTAIHVNSLRGGPTIDVVLEVSQNFVGRLIGSQGGTIKELQTRSGAKIQIDQNFPEGVPRKISISGTQTAVNLAQQLIEYVLQHGPSLPPLPGAPGAGGHAHGVPLGGGALKTVGMPGSQIIDCPKMYVGKIIGKGGETITMIQSKSGAKVQIDQSGDPCKVNISGAPQCVLVASQLVQEIVLGPSRQHQDFMQIGGGMYGGLGGIHQYHPIGQMQLQQQYQHPHMQQQQHAYGYAAQQQYASVASLATNGGGVASGVYGDGLATTLPQAKPMENWTEHKTDDGNSFWYNNTTGVSQWQRPPGF